MDRIKIQNLEVFGHHGVFSEETKLGQKFLVNATMYTNTLSLIHISEPTRH